MNTLKLYQQLARFTATITLIINTTTTTTTTTTAIKQQTTITNKIDADEYSKNSTFNFAHTQK